MPITFFYHLKQLQPQMFFSVSTTTQRLSTDLTTNPAIEKTTSSSLPSSTKETSVTSLTDTTSMSDKNVKQVPTQTPESKASKKGNDCLC